MRHSRKVKKLGRKKAHREAMVRNMLKSLFEHERVKTTIAKAKLVRQAAERLINFAMNKTVANQRLIFSTLQNRSLVKRLCDEIAPRFSNHKGGYTRIIRLGTRVGDSAELALLELTVRKVKKEETKKESKESKKK